MNPLPRGWSAAMAIFAGQLGECVFRAPFVLWSRPSVTGSIASDRRRQSVPVDKEASMRSEWG